MPQHEVASLIYNVIVFSIPLVAVYFNFRGKVEGQERRMTSVEVRLDNVQKQAIPVFQSVVKICRQDLKITRHALYLNQSPACVGVVIIIGHFEHVLLAPFLLKHSLAL